MSSKKIQRDRKKKRHIKYYTAELYRKEKVGLSTKCLSIIFSELIFDQLLNLFLEA